MGEYSYQPLRYAANNVGKYKHEPVRYHAMKAYDVDLKIAKMHQDANKFIQNQVADKVTGTIEAAKENYEFDGDAFVHSCQSQFHYDRANTYIEVARKMAEKQFPKEDFKDSFPTSYPKMPSLFDAAPDPINHKAEETYNFHRTLQKEAFMERMNCDCAMKNAEQKGTLTDENRSVGESFKNMWESIADLHGRNAEKMEGYMKEGIGADGEKEQPLPDWSGHANPFVGFLPGSI